MYCGNRSSRGAALELIRKIIDEVYREQGNFDIPSYLQIGRGSMPESGVTQHDGFYVNIKDNRHRALRYNRNLGYDPVCAGLL